ncbi:hypothetical protein NDR87_31340 [Nocardia sp. CDC159]|uniref:Uncharacterized protein n=1 Tax=Nocardia pulmonis TaxID=2951408 RepID=A0A9X2J1C2_9NOCA|nr:MULTISPECIES: hypothetical protein [Nocardia]MCM6777955.1 hypothetical protein [Nocardia pulmonis]MCM6790874.1 hypothetical protein [Nocardia sp. CDC159]
MRKDVAVTAVTAILSFVVATILFVWADSVLQQRTDDLVASRCSMRIDVPGIALVGDYLGVVLMVVSTAAFIVLTMLIARRASRFRGLGSTVAIVAAVITGLYTVIVLFGVISPSPSEPLSPDYHPCASRI